MQGQFFFFSFFPYFIFFFPPSFAIQLIRILYIFNKNLLCLYKIQQVYYLNKQMAKKLRAIRQKTGKGSRLSTMERTVHEGREYVNRITRKSRISMRSKRNAHKKAQPVQSSQQVQKTTPIKKKVTQPVRKNQPASRRVSTPAPSSAPRVLAGSIVVPPAPSTSLARSNVRANTQTHHVPTSTNNNNIIIEQQLHDRLDRHKAKIGKLNFSLRWWDPNDLDLHVICPCGTEIYYINKTCTKCGGNLDIDMNVGMNMSLEPVEHVYFNNPKPGLYKFYVQYFNGPKEHLGVRGEQKSKYALSLHEDLNQIFRYEDVVSTTQRQMHYDYQK